MSWARRAARQRDELGAPAALVEGRGAGDLDCGVPGAVRLTGDQRLPAARAVAVEPARSWSWTPPCYEKDEFGSAPLRFALLSHADCLPSRPTWRA